MHFQNHRRSISYKNQSKPCPYHSRVSSTIESPARHDKLSHSIQSTPKHSRNYINEQQQNKLPKILKKYRNQNKKPLAVASSRVVTQPIIQPSIDPEFNSYGQRIYIDYYQDLRLENEGWPSNNYFGKVYYARHDDAITKAQNRVRQIYQDEYQNIRSELYIINRIKQRYKVLKNIKEDKQKLKYRLKRITKKTTSTQIEDPHSENEKTPAYQ